MQNTFAYIVYILLGRESLNLNIKINFPIRSNFKYEF